MKGERPFYIVIDALDDLGFLHPTLRSLGLPELPAQKILIVKNSDSCEALPRQDGTWQILRSSRENEHPLYSALRFLKSLEVSEYNFAYVQAGDLLSPNWVSRSLELLTRKKNRAVIHPEITIAVSETGKRKALRNVSTTDPRFRASQAVETNLWSPVFITSSEAITRLSLPRKNTGWKQGHWYFYLETLNRDFEHAFVPRTIHLWRETSKSYSEFTDPKEDLSPYPSDFLKRDFNAPRVRPIDLFTQGQRPNESIRLPSWVEDEAAWTEDLAPYLPARPKRPTASLKQFEAIRFGRSTSAFLFEDVRKMFGESLDYLLILHQLRRGGAELEALYHIESIKRLKPDAKIAVLLTHVSDPDWSDLLPRDVRIIEYGKLVSRHFDYQENSEFLFRVISVVQPKIIHVKASELGWELFKRYGERLREFAKLYGSLYCIDYTPDDQRISFAYSHLPFANRHLTKIFSDNDALSRHLKSIYGLQNIQVLRFPSRAVPRAPEVKHSKGGKLKILWASRISRQKNIPWLKEIAKSLHKDEIHVFGEFSERNANLLQEARELFSLKNVTYHGGFDSLDSISTDEYDLFLYTSAWDGFPNILLEAGLKGLPIVSTNVGGITELLNARNSYVAASISEMMSHIENIRKQPLEAKKRALRLQNEIREVHSETQFFSILKSEFEDTFKGSLIDP